MDEDYLLAELERAASAVGVAVQRRNLDGPEGTAASGLVRLHGSQVIILHNGLTRAEQIEVMISSLRGFDMESLYLSPACREALGIG